MENLKKDKIQAQPSVMKSMADIHLKKIGISCSHSYQMLNTNWYLAYTYPRAERIADQKLKQMGITSFLPLRTIVKQWCDRKKKLEVPLFPNYIFINSLPHRRFEALTIKELVRYVSFDNKPAIVSENLINSLKKILNGSCDVLVENSFEEGMRVKINQGRFEGTEGVLIRRNGKTRLVVQVQALHTQVSIDISAHDVNPMLSK